MAMRGFGVKLENLHCVDKYGCFWVAFADTGHYTDNVENSVCACQPLAEKGGYSGFYQLQPAAPHQASLPSLKHRNLTSIRMEPESSISSDLNDQGGRLTRNHGAGIGAIGQRAFKDKVGC